MKINILVTKCENIIIKWGVVAPNGLIVALFVDEDDAIDFRDRFHPDGLVVEVQE